MKEIKLNILNKEITVPLNKNVLIFGENGSGKTVLGKTLAGLDRPWIEDENNKFSKDIHNYFKENLIKYVDCSFTKYLDVNKEIIFRYLRNCTDGEFAFHKSFLEAYSINLEKISSSVLINGFTEKDVHKKLSSGQQAILNIWWTLVSPQGGPYLFRTIYFDGIESHLSLHAQSRLLGDINLWNNSFFDYNIYVTTHAPFIYKDAEMLEYTFISLDSGETFEKATKGESND